MKPRVATPYVSPTPSQNALQDSLPARPVATHAAVQGRVRLERHARQVLLDSVETQSAHSPHERGRRRTRSLSRVNGQPVRQPRDATPVQGEWFNRIFMKVMTYLFGRTAH